jgi:hypothetical protein
VGVNLLFFVPTGVTTQSDRKTLAPDFGLGLVVSPSLIDHCKDLYDVVMLEPDITSPETFRIVQNLARVIRLSADSIGIAIGQQSSMYMAYNTIFELFEDVARVVSTEPDNRAEIVAQQRRESLSSIEG